MQKQVTSEIHVLDRIMHLLEEGSVARLTQCDATFAEFIDGLYETVNGQASTLQKVTK